MLPSPSRCVLLVAALALIACHPGGRSQSAPAAPAEAAVDAGAPVLAAVQNARAAIAAGDQVAAFNDVNLGLGYATRLADAESTLYPPEAAPPGYADRGGGGDGGQGGQGGQAGSAGARAGGAGRHHHGGSQPAAAASSPAVAAAPAAPPKADATAARHHQGRAAAPAPLTSFDAQVRLISAQAKLQARDAAGADAELQALEAAADVAPASLPLIRADQSLALAAASISGGRRAELRTQLAAAQGALEGYRGGPHAAEAKALAAAIGEAMRSPAGLGALAPAQLALWSGQVDSWT